MLSVPLGRQYLIQKYSQGEGLWGQGGEEVCAKKEETRSQGSEQELRLAASLQPSWGTRKQHESLGGRVPWRKSVIKHAR